MDVFREIFDSYELLFYIPIRASRIGLRVCEVPVKRSYPKSGQIPTKIRGINSYLNLIKILAYAVIGKYNPSKSSHFN